MLKVTDVDYLGKYTLLCTFSTGEKKKVDLTPLLQYPAFEELKDEKQFIQFGLDGTIFWANGADIAPEYLYDNGILANGKQEISEVTKWLSGQHNFTIRTLTMLPTYFDRALIVPA